MFAKSVSMVTQQDITTADSENQLLLSLTHESYNSLFIKKISFGGTGVWIQDLFLLDKLNCFYGQGPC
jgi:hypothetical protein